MHKSKKIGEKEKDTWNQEHGNQINTKYEIEKNQKLSQKEQKLRHIEVRR